ncbi:hypothetical protein KO465_03905 [Candidatus Micrarchaeota archaeon]|nr:hypothetical protein [Candidatus Micrarchaeota archaeon]
MARIGYDRTILGHIKEEVKRARKEENPVEAAKILEEVLRFKGLAEIPSIEEFEAKQGVIIDDLIGLGEIVKRINEKNRKKIVSIILIADGVNVIQDEVNFGKTAIKEAVKQRDKWENNMDDKNAVLGGIKKFFAGVAVLATLPISYHAVKYFMANPGFIVTDFKSIMATLANSALIFITVPLFALGFSQWVCNKKIRENVGKAELPERLFSEKIRIKMLKWVGKAKDEAKQIIELTKEIKNVAEGKTKEAAYLCREAVELEEDAIQIERRLGPFVETNE